MTDVRIYHTPDGGEIDYVNGLAVMDTGLESAVYLSLFGGNEHDSGLTVDDKHQYWANLSEPIAARHLRSETQYLLRSIPAIPGNLLRIEDAVRNDLTWMVPDVATSVDASASMPGVDKIDIQTVIIIGDNVFRFTFPERWGQAA